MYGISTKGLPRIHNYAEAERLFHTIKPVRGKPHIRPLGYRRKQHMRICNGTRDGKNYYAALLYSTEVIRWFEDGTITLNCNNWVTQSTAAFIDRVCGIAGCGLFDSKLWVRVAQKNYPIWLSQSSATLRLSPSPENPRNYICVNEPEYCRTTYNKTETKRLRELPAVKALREYLKAIGALGGWADARVWWLKRDESMRKMLEAPYTTPEIELMSCFGNATMGHFELDWFYKTCLRAGITSENDLYVAAPWDPSQAPVKGVRSK